MSMITIDEIATKAREVRDKQRRYLLTDGRTPGREQLFKEVTKEEHELDELLIKYYPQHLHALPDLFHKVNKVRTLQIKYWKGRRTGSVPWSESKVTLLESKKEEQELDKMLTEFFSGPQPTQEKLF